MYQSGSLQYRQLGTSQLKKQGARLHPSGTHTPQRTVGRMFHCRSTSGHNGKIQGSHRTRITEESYPNPGRGNSNQRGNHNPAEKQGYYNHGEESIISLICDITWAGKKTTDENGSVWQGTYKFNKNGTYTRTNIEIDKQGNKKEANIYGQWSFGDPSFSTIYFGGEHYWDIDELTKNKFSFYDRSGKFGDPFMNREYIELTPYQENNTTN